MKKIVPDPPLFSCVTGQTAVGHCPEHPELFSVNAGISAEDALIHAHLLLKCAFITCAQSIEHGSGPAQGFAQCTQHSLEMASGLIDAVIEGFTLQA